MKRLVQILAVILVGTLFMAEAHGKNNVFDTRDGASWSAPGIEPTQDNWTLNSFWVGNNNPGTVENGNNGLGGTVNIGNSGNPHHYILRIGNLGTGNSTNDLIINVYKNATLKIVGELSIGNKFQLNVQDGGKFIVEGNVSFHNNGVLTVNGDAVVTGDIESNDGGQLLGDGNVYVGGTSNVNTNNFDGVLAEDVPEYSIAVPYNLDVVELGYLQVYLEWSFDGETEIVINGENYQFAGFRIVRNLNDNNNVFRTIIAGEFYYENDLIVGFNNNAIDPSFTDYIPEAEFLAAKEINTDNKVKPEYYVRAVYQKVAKNDISDYKLSEKSESAQTLEPLPIELLRFSAQPANGEVVVEWSTAAEINNDFFTVERSIDGNSWETLTFINGAGNANYVINYSYTDSNPIEGVSYYRLKQTDFDGQYEYFAPAAVNFSSNVSSAEIIRVVPSAQKMEVWFQNQDPNAILTVADMQGRILYNSNARVADFVQQISINLPRNYSGEVVMVNLRTNDKTDEVKLIVR